MSYAIIDRMNLGYDNQAFGPLYIRQTFKIHTAVYRNDDLHLYIRSC